MSRDPEPPIAEELRASGISLSYADWADVHAGRYERVADRVLRQAKWMARVAIGTDRVRSASCWRLV
jgi:hypothetical protein